MVLMGNRDSGEYVSTHQGEGQGSLPHSLAEGSEASTAALSKHLRGHAVWSSTLCEFFFTRNACSLYTQGLVSGLLDGKVWTVSVVHQHPDSVPRPGILEELCISFNRFYVNHVKNTW